MADLRSTEDRVALLKLETTYATDPSPVAANAILLMNSTISLIADKLEREVDQPYFGANPFVLVGKRVELDADCDLLGAATPGEAAPLGVLYKICGHKETLNAGPPADTTYNPIARQVASATLYFYYAGILCKMTGVRGNLDFTDEIKKFGMGKVKLTGLFSIPTDAEAPTGIDWSAFQTPPSIETETWTVTAGGVAVNATKLAVTGGGEVQLYEGSESRQVVIRDRKPTGVLTVFKDIALATWNPWSIAEAHTPTEIVATITKSAGLNCVKTIQAQLEFAKPTEIDGVLGLEIPFACVPDEGDDEYTIKYT